MIQLRQNGAQQYRVHVSWQTQYCRDVISLSCVVVGIILSYCSLSLQWKSCNYISYIFYWTKTLAVVSQSIKARRPIDLNHLYNVPYPPYFNTLRPRKEMAAIFQTTFQSVSLKQTHCVSITISQRFQQQANIGLDNGLTPKRWQTIIWPTMV